jgi:hypothetical protein
MEVRRIDVGVVGVDVRPEGAASEREPERDALYAISSNCTYNSAPAVVRSAAGEAARVRSLGHDTEGALLGVSNQSFGAAEILAAD